MDFLHGLALFSTGACALILHDDTHTNLRHGLSLHYFLVSFVAWFRHNVRNTRWRYGFAATFSIHLWHGLSPCFSYSLTVVAWIRCNHTYNIYGPLMAWTSVVVFH